MNGIPLVIMEAKAPSLMAMGGSMSPFDPQPWMEKGVEQLRRYQEAEPKWHGTGAPELFYYNLMCVAHCGAAAVYAGVGRAPQRVFPVEVHPALVRTGDAGPLWSRADGTGAIDHRAAVTGHAA